MSTHTEHTATPPPLALAPSLSPLWKPLAIRAAARLRLAEALADSPRTVTQLAVATGTHAPSLYRLLRALARIGIFAELDGARFTNSELSHFLRPDVPGSMYAVAMTNFSAAVDAPVAQAADLSGVRTVVNVGGGHGGLLTTLLATHPSIEMGILFDQPHVIDEAQAELDPAPDGRIQLVGGDFFTAIPAGADAYVMKWILRDWDDAACLQLLTTCRRAMPPHSRLLAAELVLDPDRSDEYAYFLDLEMLFGVTGRERTAAEFRALYDAAGLHLTRIIPTTSMFSLIEGIPRGNK